MLPLPMTALQCCWTLQQLLNLHLQWQALKLTSRVYPVFALILSSPLNNPLDIVDNHLAALGTGLEGHLQLDEAEEVEKQRATEDFYVGVKPEEAPGQFYAPLINETSGYGNYREGMEDFPEMWQPDTECMAQPLVPSSEETPAEVVKSAKAPKAMLKPKSRKAPKHDIYMADYESNNAHSPIALPPPTEQVTYTDSLSKSMFSLYIPLTARDLKSADASQANKRTAPDSFSAQTTIHHTIKDEEGKNSIPPLPRHTHPKITNNNRTRRVPRRPPKQETPRHRARSQRRDPTGAKLTRHLSPQRRLRLL